MSTSPSRHPAVPPQNLHASTLEQQDAAELHVDLPSGQAPGTEVGEPSRSIAVAGGPRLTTRHEWVLAQNERTEAELFDAEFEANRARNTQGSRCHGPHPDGDQARRTLLQLLARCRSPQGPVAAYRLGVLPEPIPRSGTFCSTLMRSPPTTEPIGCSPEPSCCARRQGTRTHRALIKLSPDGGDQVRVREFDLGARDFVPGGFDLPVAKTNVSWRDEDTLYVATDVGKAR